jgi:ribosomal protein S6--L-glutamate ligase
MGLHIGVLSVKGLEYHPTRRLMEAAVARGHTVTRIHPYCFWPAFNKQGKTAFFIGDEGKIPDAVLPRQGSDVGPSCLALIRQFELLRIPVINDFNAVRISRHQFHTLQSFSSAGIPFPDSIFVNSVDGFFQAVKALGGYPVVVKQVSQRQGSGVAKIDSDGMVRPILDDSMGKDQAKRKGLLVQRYLSTQGRQDIRVLVIGERVAGAQALTPTKGDFRANFHLSGHSRPFDMPPRIEDLSLRAAQAVGLDIAGVDLMIKKGEDPQVVEVNYAPGFEGLEAATGHDIAGEIIDYVVCRVKSAPKK